MDVKEAVAQISDEQWSQLAKATGMTVEEARTHYESVLLDIQNNPEVQRPTNVIRGEVSEANGYLQVPVHWCPVPIVCFDLNVRYQGGSDWFMGATLSVSFAGMSVWSKELDLSPAQSYVHLQIDAMRIHLDMYVGVRGDRRCIYVQGTGQYWAFSSQNIGSFDQDLHCFE